MPLEEHDHKKKTTFLMEIDESEGSDSSGETIPVLEAAPADLIMATVEPIASANSPMVSSPSSSVESSSPTSSPEKDEPTVVKKEDRPLTPVIMPSVACQSSSEPSVVQVTRSACPTKADGSPVCAECPSRAFDRQTLNVQVKAVIPTRTVREMGTQTEDHSVDEVRGLLESRFGRRIPPSLLLNGLRDHEVELLLSFGLGVAATLLIQRFMRR